MNTTFFTNTLPTDTAQLVESMQQKRPAFLSSFYLSGGTGLSLQLGHRESQDLDFFSQKLFDPTDLEPQLATLGTLAQTELAEGTLNTFLNGVKLQFLAYPYPLLEPLIDWQGIHLSSVLDIACTKLQTVSMRGSKKDFLDLYFILEKYSLAELLRFTQQKYAATDYSQTHILKSLVYFVDAEVQPMSRLHQPIQWEEVKTKLVQAVKNTPLTA